MPSSGIRGRDQHRRSPLRAGRDRGRARRRRAQGAVFQSRRPMAQASGDVIVDASGQTRPIRCAAISPACALLPLLRSAAGFDKIDGKLAGEKIAVRSSGTSQRAILSNLDGTVFALFQDGAIRGLNVAQMIRSLTSGTLFGMAGGQGTSHRPDPAVGVVPHREGPGDHQRSQSGRPLVRVTGAGTVDLGAQTLALAGRAEARDDDRGPGPDLRSGRARHSRRDRRPLGPSRASIPT